MNKLKPKAVIMPENIICILFTIFITLLASGCKNSFDYVNYRELYLEIVDGSTLEKGYVALQNLFRSLGADYSTFRVCIIAIPILLRAYMEYKLIGSKLWILEFFYLFYALPFDMVNIRNNIGNTFILLGIIWALKTKRFRVVKYILCCIVGATFHTNCLAYGIFAFAIWKLEKDREKSTKKNHFLLTLLGLVIFLSFVISKSFLQKVADLVLESLYYIGLSSAKNVYFEVLGNWGFLGSAGCHFFFLFTIAYIRYLLPKKIENYNLSCDTVILKHRFVELVHTINVLLIYYLPIIRVSGEFHRIYKGIAWLEYLAFLIGISCINGKKREKTNAYFLMIITVIINFVFQIMPYYDIVFSKMFTSNIFW